ncbi:MAG: type IV secretory system conjugative DNA transfer family protein [Candidatus Kerfeldbacteria bacterium]|nr:type IV secretory system conjugative DNA transfer family protein [Candidatus Kerfeldbacteria bacterium]
MLTTAPTLEVDSVASAVAGISGAQTLNAATWLTAAVSGIAGTVIALRWLLHYLARTSASMQKVVLLATVPKEQSQDEHQRTPDPKEVLAQLETFALNLGGLPAQRSANVIKNAWDNFWFGRHDELALEIVADQGLIKFFVIVPRFLQQLVELQLHAQYPKAQLEEVPDYNIFSPRGPIMAGYLHLTKRSMFPIRSYKKLDADPLNALTNVLSKIGDDAGAAIQILLRPARGHWQQTGQRVAHKLQHGKQLSEAMGAAGLAGALKSAAKVSTSSLSTSTPGQSNQFRMPYLTPMEQELVKALEEKASKPGFEVNIRLLSSAPDQQRTRANLINITNAFTQYRGQETENGFVRRRLLRRSAFIKAFIYRHFSHRHRFILNSEELTSLWHLPLPTTETPNILWLHARTAPAPANLPAGGISLGKNVFRGVEQLVRIKRDDRRRHVYIIGMTGSGKSVLMAEMAKQDIRAGEGVCVVDPHGSLVEDVIQSIPRERFDDVVYFDPSDVERPVGLNMLEAGSVQERDFAVQEMIAIFYKLFPPEMIGPMFEHNMRNAMLTLMEDRQSPGTIAEIPRMFTDTAFQKYKVAKVTDPVVRAFWEKEMAKTSDFHKSEMLGYLVSKVGRFVENAMMRNIIGQPSSGFNLRQMMDQKKILLVNLSKGKVGEVNANLLGLIIVSKLQMAALSRADVPEPQRNDFYLYIDEFQNFITDSIATILSEARKYKLNLTMAHQYMGQLVQGQDTKIRDAVLGNVGTLLAFRIGVEDAEILEKQFAPVFSLFDLVNIDRFNAYVRLLVDNRVTKPFSLATFPPWPGSPAIATEVKQLSRLKYGRDQAIVEAEILERSRLGSVAAPPPAQPMAERRF